MTYSEEVTNKNGQSRVRNQVNWARLYLVHAGYLNSSQRGVWVLTKKGISLDLKVFDALSTFEQAREYIEEKIKSKNQTEQFIGESDEQEDEPEGYKAKLLNLIKQLPPSGFERLSKRLLDESGLEEVKVKGGSGDGGIDGTGILKLNPFVSFPVVFQCKRYKGVVTPTHVRDFRGAMTGRTEKGIMITTGTFTLGAKKEAQRAGATPIELVDGELLVEMFERLELGLIPHKTYYVDEIFFEDFKN